MDLKTERIFIGIDVGKDGGIVVLDINQNIIAKTCIPKIGDKVDYKHLFKFLYDYKDRDVFVAIEEVHSIFGASAKSNFSFGEIKGVEVGMIEALSVLCNYRYIMVQPKDWQKRIWNVHDIVYKPQKPNVKIQRKVIDTKKTSLIASRRLFPREDFLKSTRSEKAHDGLVDAALIALYLNFILNNNN